MKKRTGHLLLEVSGLPVLVNINRGEGKRRAGLEVLDAAEEVYETMTCGYPSREHFDLNAIGAQINRLKKELAAKKNPSAVQKVNWFIDFMNACRLYGAMLDELDGINTDADHGRRQLKHLEDGRQKKNGTQDEIRNRWAAYQAAFDDARAKNPHRPKGWCYDKVAKKFRVSSKTISRRVQQ